MFCGSSFCLWVGKRILSCIFAGGCIYEWSPKNYNKPAEFFKKKGIIMLPAIILFAATYVLMIAFGKYRPYIALTSGLCRRRSGKSHA